MVGLSFGECGDWIVSRWIFRTFMEEVVVGASDDAEVAYCARVALANRMLDVSVMAAPLDVRFRSRVEAVAREELRLNPGTTVRSGPDKVLYGRALEELLTIGRRYTWGEQDAIAQELRSLMTDLVSGLPARDATFVRERLETKEIGPAFEHLCGQLRQYDIPVARRSLEALHAVGSRMNADPRSWEMLRRKTTDPTACLAGSEGRAVHASNVAFVGALVYRHRVFLPLLAEHLEENFGEVLPHLLMADFERWVESKIADPAAIPEIQSIVDHLEEGIANEDVAELIHVSFLEHLPRPGTPGSELRDMLGPRLTCHLAQIG